MTTLNQSSAAECAKQLQVFRETGVDEIALYGSTPADNRGLIAAWRDLTAS